MNVDEAQDIAGGYGIISIPTLKIFKNGNIAGSIAGAAPKDRKTMIKTHLLDR